MIHLRTIWIIAMFAFILAFPFLLYAGGGGGGASSSSGGGGGGGVPEPISLGLLSMGAAGYGIYRWFSKK